MKKLRARVDYVLKHNQIVNKIFRNIASFGVRAIGIFTPIDNKSIIFSGHSRKYNDSPRAIYECMIKDSRFSDYTFYWALDNPEEANIPGDCIKVIPDTFTYFKTALKCKYWITCVNIERSLNFKRKNNIYLNTWHGIPIKTIGNLASGRKDYDFSYVDYFCVSSEYEEDIYKKAFNINDNQLLKSGLPRNDELYNVSIDEIKEIKNKLDLPEDKKIVLYAPTWRDSNDSGKSYVLKPPIDFSKWKEKLGDEYVLLLRTHPYTNTLLGVEFNDFVRDYSNYSCINDLLKVADILISDYSATIFDYSILGRPIICFAYDYDEYSKERGFLIDLKEEMPWAMCYTEEEVLDKITNIDEKQDDKQASMFAQKYVSYGGNAVEKCIKAIFEDECKK